MIIPILSVYNNPEKRHMQGQNSKQSATQAQNLIIPQQFTYQFFEANRYSISQRGNYQALCNNGFIKLYTKLCRVYWHTQNQFGHETQDWKFHISVKHHHLKKAWNLIAALFIKMNCRAGMKVIYLKQAQDPQQGREITIYIVKYDPSFEKSQFAGQFGLDISIEHSEDYWLAMCRNIEEILDSYGIASNGLADGDFKLGKYISLRNEAYIRNVKGEGIYPPNDSGWNPLKQELPIDLNKFSSLDQADMAESTMGWKTYLMGLMFVVTIGMFVTFKLKSFRTGK